MDHLQMLGRWDDRPSDPAYYIEDCRISNTCLPRGGIPTKNWSSGKSLCIYRQICLLLSNLFAPLLTYTVYIHCRILFAKLCLGKQNITEYIFIWEDRIDKKGPKGAQIKYRQFVIDFRVTKKQKCLFFIVSLDILLELIWIQ